MGGKDFARGQRLTDGCPLANPQCGVLDSPFHGQAVDDLGGNPQRFEHGYGARGENAEGARKARGIQSPDELADQGHPQHEPVEAKARIRRLEPAQKPPGGRGHHDQGIEPVMADEVAHADQDARGDRQFLMAGVEYRHDLRHDIGQQKGHDGEGEDHQHDGVDQRVADLLSHDLARFGVIRSRSSTESSLPDCSPADTVAR